MQYFAGMNLYEYCGDNPTNGTDPSGLEENVDGIPVSIEPVIGETSIWDFLAPVTPAGPWGQPSSRTKWNCHKRRCVGDDINHNMRGNVCNGIRQGSGVGAGGTILAKVKLPGPGNYKVTWLWQVCCNYGCSERSGHD